MTRLFPHTPPLGLVWLPPPVTRLEDGGLRGGTWGARGDATPAPASARLDPPGRNVRERSRLFAMRLCGRAVAREGARRPWWPSAGGSIQEGMGWAPTRCHRRHPHRRCIVLRCAAKKALPSPSHTPSTPSALARSPCTRPLLPARR